MAEAIRLVVWDMDETFWKGTLTEGGIIYNRATHEIVLELARRGIMSSICSKNNFEDVKRILTREGIWDYFVFPSIDWSPKGPRLAALVDGVQLRSPTILFIDDNPINLAEAQHFVPGIQVASDGIIPRLLSDPLLRGKDDAGLTRLKQYKLLETRNLELAASSDTTEFLRTSDIRIEIDHDIAGKIDRAIELINRTNQLNFTKKRLPEDGQRAREDLLNLINRYDVQSGLVRVIDRYGDYGYVGIYVQRRAVHSGSELLHFCFSCRTLGMNVETWLYRKLGRPRIKVVGEVLTDIKDDSAHIDWIRLTRGGEESSVEKSIAPIRRNVRLRGGCELLAISHYFNLIADKVTGEFAFSRDDVNLRLEHSLMLRYAICGVSEPDQGSFEKLGFKKEDFETRLFDFGGEDDVYVFSFWGDPDHTVYRHRLKGLYVPFNAGPLVRARDFTKVDLDQLDRSLQGHWIVEALENLKKDYEYVGLIPDELFVQNLNAIFSKVPSFAKVFVLESNTRRFWPDKGEIRSVPHHEKFNQLCRHVARDYANVSIIPINSFLDVRADVEPDTVNHFHRKVYFKLYEEIVRQISNPQVMRDWLDDTSTAYASA